MPTQELDRLEAMRAFAAVGQRLSFVAAAEELEISASALSRRIAQLETVLGNRLLHRTTRRVTLTEAGAFYLDRCIDILTRTEEAEAAMSNLAQEPQGLLRVALPSLYGQLCVAPLLPGFMQQFPKLKLELAFDDRFIDLVDRRIDVGIRIGNLESGEYIARKLAPNKRRLVASPSYVERCGAPAVITDLRDHDCLHFSPLMTESHWRFSQQGRKVEIPINAVLKADNAEALRQAALGGLGIGLLADFVIGDDLMAGRLVEILPDWSVAESWVFAIYPHARFLPMKTRVFVDFIANAIRS